MGPEGLWWTNILNSALPPQRLRLDTRLEHQDPVSHIAFTWGGVLQPTPGGSAAMAALCLRQGTGSGGHCQRKLDSGVEVIPGGSPPSEIFLIIVTYKFIKKVTYKFIKIL